MDLTKKLDYETLSRKDFKPSRSSKLQDVTITTNAYKNRISVQIMAETSLWGVDLDFSYKDNKLLDVESEDFSSILGQTFLKKWISGIGKRYVDIWVYRRIMDKYQAIRSRMLYQLSIEANKKRIETNKKKNEKLKEVAEYRKFLKLKEKYGKRGNKEGG